LSIKEFEGGKKRLDHIVPHNVLFLKSWGGK